MVKHLLPFWFSLLACGCGARAPVVSPAPNPVPIPSNHRPIAIDKPNENDAAFYVEQLESSTGDATAIRRLGQLFEDAVAQDSQDRNGPHVKSLREQIVAPLVRVCLSGQLNGQVQSQIVELLYDTRDVRGGACFAKTIEKQVSGPMDKTLQTALQAVVAMKVPEAVEPVFALFNRMQLSNPDHLRIYRDVNEAIVALSHPSWDTPCIATLDKLAPDRKDTKEVLDVAFHQLTCAQVVGNLRSEKAVPSLVRIMLSPLAVQAQSTAINALIKIGKPAIAPVLAILRGQDKTLVDFAKSEYLRANSSGTPSNEDHRMASAAYILPSAVILGSIGHEDAVTPMIEISKKTDLASKVIIARELLKLPYSPTVMNAIQSIYEKTPIDLTIPPGMSARGALIEQMGYTFEPRLIPWLVKDTVGKKGVPEDLDEVRGDALVLVIKLAKFDQIGEIDKLARLSDSSGSTIGAGYAKEVDLTKRLLTECRDDLACYLAKLIDPRSHVGDSQFIGIKCAYMAGVLGGPDVRAKLVEMLPNISGAAARFVTVQVIDHFSPKGDVTISDALMKMYADAQASKNADRIANTSYFLQFALRLRARAM